MGKSNLLFVPIIVPWLSEFTKGILLITYKLNLPETLLSQLNVACSLPAWTLKLVILGVSYGEPDIIVLLIDTLPTKSTTSIL